jgi:glucan endo-1,3-alpha-glucosidase
MVPVTPYYLGRGGNNRVFENDGFAAMAAQWRAAIESKAPWVQIVTWNDWTENSYVRPFASPAISPEHWPSLLAHDGFLEASRPYIAWFKTAREPAIKGTRVTLFFRPQTSPGCGPGGVGGRDPLACPSGWQTLRDRLWVDVESAAPVRLRIANGGRDTTVTLPAGRQTHEVPISPGLLSIDAQAGEWRRIWNAPVHIGADARRFGRGMIAVSL